MGREGGRVMVRLIRLRSGEDFIGGVLVVRGEVVAQTLELPWLGNRRRVSCIPCGEYVMERIESPKFGEVYEIQGVENRSEILIHKGNNVDDTSGCILVGSSRVGGDLYGSRVAFDDMMRLLVEERYMLGVKEVLG